MSIDASLRPLQPEDSDRLLAWRNLPEVSRWMYNDHLITREEHERWFAGAIGASDRRYWVIEYESQPVGLANLADISLEESRADWAFYLADPSVRGSGLGAFVEYMVIERTFEELGLQELYCEVIVENAAVLKLHERFGFQRIAALEGRAVKAGIPVDVIRYRLRASDWSDLRDRSRDILRKRGYPL